MVFEYKIYIERAQNELNLASILQKISNDKKIQVEIFGVKGDTYFSAVISHAYYSIFYAAKAYLLLKGIKVHAPEEHKKVFNEFKKFVQNGELDVELLKIYQSMLVKADTLLNIFELEKGKRGKFTYRRMPQANKEPAGKSIEHSKIFFKHVLAILQK